ncbi:YceI family protein [Flavobacteriaceae bacterium KMM 6897]|nr:YceI family protein [Flavobacteriaceae bacterium KMM 6897]MEB8345860.1 YceI family protein [Flavobacteriaceae bacterium KMM 6898]
MINSIYKALCISITLITCVSQNTNAQNKYIERNGEIRFEASENLFEEVKAINKSVTCILDIETKQIAALALIKGFRFKNSLMEEHFNENYIESEKYPKATFKGKLLDFNYSELTENWLELEVDGKLQLHGKEKQVRSTMKFQKVDGSVVMKGSFIVTPSDFEIKIPKIVRNKIAKEVTVNIDFKLVQE